MEKSMIEFNQEFFERAFSNATEENHALISYHIRLMLEGSLNDLFLRLHAGIILHELIWAYKSGENCGR